MFIQGIIFGILYVYSDSLWGAITGHMAIGILEVCNSMFRIYGSKIPEVTHIWKIAYILILIVSLILAINFYRKKKIGELIFGKKL